MPRNISFVPFTDPLILFASKDAANQFFQQVTVPDATGAAKGVVTAAGNIPATNLPATTYVTLDVVDEAGVVTPTLVPTKASYDALYSAMATLLVNLKVAGIMVGDA